METNLLNIVRRFLPNGAMLINPKNPVKTPAVQMADLDGDKLPEIITAYQWHGEPHVLVLKNNGGLWYRLADIKGKGFNINYLGFANVTGNEYADLLVGWQIGAVWAELNIFSFHFGEFKRIVDNLPYSILDIVNLPGKCLGQGSAQLATWNHVTGEAYEVEVLCWDGSKLVQNKKVYHYYFKKVTEYYEKKVREMPGAAFYWYYLADAQIKAGMPDQALKSIAAGMELKMDYPSAKDFEKLKEEAMSEIAAREVNLYPASYSTIDGVKWGYINESGEFAIKAVYDWAQDFQYNGLAVVTVKELSGLINSSGEYIVEPKYSDIEDFSEDRAVTVGPKGFKVIDEGGNVIFESGNYIGTFHDGRAVFSGLGAQDKILYGYIDKQGNIVVPARYETAGDFKNGKAVVKSGNGKYSVIDIDGHIIGNFNYAFVGDISEGLMPFQEESNGKYGFIDETGSVVIRPMFTGIEGFKNGRAIVNTGENYSNRYGLIDRTGRFVISPDYNDILSLGEGMYAVGRAVDINKPYLGSKYAVADKNGQILTEFIYTDITNYENGFASASDGLDTFFIDKKGVRAAGLPVVKGIGTLSFSGNMIKAYVDNRVTYLDRSGRPVWAQNNIIRLNSRYSVREFKYKPNTDYLVYYPQITGMENSQLEVRVNFRLRKISLVKPIDSSTQLDYSYQGDFEVEFFRKDLVVIKITGYDYHFGAAHGMPSRVYAHVDLRSGRFYILKDLFKQNSDYVKVISDIIRKQIEAQGDDSYIWIDSYKGIKEDQPFFISGDALHIYFAPYEIAPYAAGFPVFTIPYRDIISIIDVQGSFWRSFN